MKPLNTRELDTFLQNCTPEEYEAYKSGMYVKPYKNISEFLNDYISKHHLVLSSIVKKSGLSKDYAYNIFSGHKVNPTRDRVLSLCLAMEMPLEDVNRALTIANVGVLYSKNSRDAFIIICINKKLFDLYTVNEILLSHNELPIKPIND